MWSPGIPLSHLSSDELFARAAKYRRMAILTAIPEVRVSLDKLAIRYAMLAAARKIAETDTRSSVRIHGVVSHCRAEC